MTDAPRPAVAGVIALAPVAALGVGEALSLPTVPLLAAAALLLAATWRHVAPALRVVGLAALAISAAQGLHLHALRASWDRRSAQLLDQKLRAVEARKASLVARLQRGARAVAALPEALAALGGSHPERVLLFSALEEQRRFEPGLALAVHDPSLETVAWTGRVAELQGFEGLVPADVGVFALEGTLTTTWVASAPIHDARGQIRGRATAELAVAARRHLRNEFLDDFDLLGAQDPDIEINAIDVRDPGEEAHPFPPLQRRAASRQAILRAPSSLPLAAARVTAPQPEHAGAELRAHYRAALAAAACAAVVLWVWPRRQQRATLALGFTLVRVAILALGPPLPRPWDVFSSDVYASPLAGSLAGDALRALGLSTLAPRAEALLGPLLRSPADLLLTSLWVLALAGLLLERAVCLPARALKPLRAALGSVLALPILAGTFAWISDTVSNSPLDLAVVGLWPRSAAHLLIEVSLLAILGAGLALVTTILTLTCPMPAKPAGRALLLALWLVLGLLAERNWPRQLIGLPLGSAVLLFLIAALFGSDAGSWRERLRRRSIEARAVLSLAALALLAALLYPAVAHYSEKNVRQQIQHEHAPLVRRQPQWRDYVMAAARREVDRMDLLKATPPGRHPPGIEEIAFAVWASTDLASAGLSSAVEIQDASGGILGRFAFNLPTLGVTATALPPSESWSEAWDTLPVGSAGRRVLHAARRIVVAGGLRGAVHLYAGDDYSNLPFLAGKDPYSTLYRSAPRGGRRDRPVDLLVYGADQRIVFSSADRPPALDPDLAARAARPSGVWATLQVDGRPQHTFLFTEGERTFGLCYPRTGALRFCADLAEAVTSSTLLGILALILVVTYRTLRRRSGLSIPSLHAAVERKFALRVFAAFVVLAILPVGVLQMIVGKFVRDRFWKESDDQALELAAVARKAVEDFAFFQRGESPSERPVTDAALVWIASLIRNDLDVFERERVLASSKRELYASGLLPLRVSGAVYRTLVLGGQPAFLGRETIGGFSYRVVSVPVSLGTGTGILSIPLALREREAEAALDDLDRTINLASVLFLGLAAALAHSMSGRISGPIQALTQATRRVALGDLAARVETHRRDELQDLVDAFNQMAGDLSRQRQELERSNRLAAWAEMARQVAHEIKNPLTPIQLSAEHLRRVFRDPGGDFPAALETCTSGILRQVQILRDIATEFSAFARPPAAAPEPVDLGSVAKDVVRPYVGVLPSGVTLQLALEGAPLAVLGDRRLLERALVNLIENALQAVGDHGTVTIRLGRRDARVEVAVEDTGPGVSLEARARAFEAFFSTKTGGSGLGLALVKKIAEDHGGDVALESPGQGGARALLWLPAAPAEVGPAQ